MTRVRSEWIWLFLGFGVLYIGSMYALVQDINFLLLCGSYCFHLFATHRRW